MPGLWPGPAQQNVPSWSPNPFAQGAWLGHCPAWGWAGVLCLA